MRAGAEMPGQADRRALPPGLRERIMARALDPREPGQLVDPPPDIEPAEALRRTVHALDGLLAGLTAPEWEAPSIRGLTVQGLVGHLIGVERDFLAALRGVAATEALALDHVTSTRASVLEQRGKTPEQTLHDWRQESGATLSVLGRQRVPDLLSMHGLTLPRQDFVVVRAFEVWTHQEDMAAATGRPGIPPDDSTLALMTRLATALLPYGMVRAGRSSPATIRLVLTGGGGGTFNVSVDGHRPGAAGTAHPDRTVLVMDALQFCRVAANRLPDDALTVDVAGDARLAAQTLAGARALALD